MSEAQLTSTTRFTSATKHLRRVDPILRDLIHRVGPCTLVRSRNHFLTLLEAIVWQQLSWSAACAIHERLLAALRTGRPRPADILALSQGELLRTGLSRQKCLYVRGLALFFENNRFPRGRINQLGDEEIIDLLTGINGIGRWTAEMFLIFGLNRQDVFPVGDLGLRKAIGRHYSEDLPLAEETLKRVTTPWRPYRTIATWYLWKSADGEPFDQNS